MREAVMDAAWARQWGSVMAGPVDLRLKFISLA